MSTQVDLTKSQLDALRRTAKAGALSLTVPTDQVIQMLDEIERRRAASDAWPSRDDDAEYLAEIYYDANWSERVHGTESRWSQLQPEHRMHKTEAMRRFLGEMPEATGWGE